MKETIKTADLLQVVEDLINAENKNCADYIKMNAGGAWNDERRRERDLICAAYCRVLYYVGKLARGEHFTI